MMMENERGVEGVEGIGRQHGRVDFTRFEKLFQLLQFANVSGMPAIHIIVVDVQIVRVEQLRGPHHALEVFVVFTSPSVLNGELFLEDWVALHWE